MQHFTFQSKTFVFNVIRRLMRGGVNIDRPPELGCGLELSFRSEDFSRVNQTHWQANDDMKCQIYCKDCLLSWLHRPVLVSFYSVQMAHFLIQIRKNNDSIHLPIPIRVEWIFALAECPACCRYYYKTDYRWGVPFHGQLNQVHLFHSKHSKFNQQNRKRREK